MSCLNISIRPKGTLQSEEKESLSIQASPQHSHQMQKARTISNVKQSHSREASSHLLAEHGQVGLADDKGEEEVDANSDGLPSSSGLNVVELRGHQPPQGAPGPGKPSSEQALKRQNGGGGILGDVAGDLVEAAAHDAGHNHKADEHLDASLNQQDLASKPTGNSISICWNSRKVDWQLCTCSSATMLESTTSYLHHANVSLSHACIRHVCMLYMHMSSCRPSDMTGVVIILNRNNLSL